MGMEVVFPAVFLFTFIFGALVWFRKSLIALLGSFISPKDDEEIELQDQRNPLLHRTAQSAAFQSIPWSNVLQFTLNGKSMQIINPDPSELLATYLRDKLSLKGTKLGCEEGGCGACTIMLEHADGSVMAANSCLRPLCANDGLAITTVEGIGSVQSGLSPEQQSIVNHNGTQCGYCTPGWITAAHSLKEAAEREGKPLRKEDFDHKLDGNICRCTGYRPIMQAFHSLCDESHCSPGTISQCQTMYEDIEDLNACPTSHHIIKPAKKSKALQVRSAPKPLMFNSPLSGNKYYRPVNLQQLSCVLNEYQEHNMSHMVKIVSGNTSIGVTKYLNNTQPFYLADEFPILVDVNIVPELHEKTYIATTGELTVGAALPITEVISLLKSYAKPQEKKDSMPIAEGVDSTSVFSVTAYHLTRVANTQVRNVASWAGNLMMFLQYKQFPSDVLLCLATANASLKLSDTNNNISYMAMEDFMAFDYDTFKSQGLFILAFNIKESAAGVETVMETFKIARREHNAHAFVDAGFQLQIQTRPVYAPICLSARIVFGGISAQVFIAKNTQTSMASKPLTFATLQDSIRALQVDWQQAGGVNSYLTNKDFILSATYACLYRIFLRSYPIHLLPPSTVSALLPWSKPISRGVEVFPVDRQDNPLYPVGKPIKKLEGPIQSTGQAVYPSDEPLPTNGLYGALVYSTQCNAPLLAINTASAMQMAGVVAVLTAADLPGANQTGTGVNIFVPFGATVPCVGACLGVVVAESEEIANKAVALVQVTYGTSVGTPITSLAQAIAEKSFYPPNPDASEISIGDADQGLSTATFKAKGRFSAAGQYHFYMETQTAIANLVDGEKVEIVCGTQMPSGNQSVIASNLSLSSNQLVVSCKRTGGGFGGKLTGAVTVATAAGLCALNLRRPVRIFNTRTADMNMQGGREEWAGDYEVGFEGDGTVTALKYNFYLDAGAGSDDTLGGLFMGMNWADNAYFFPNYYAYGLMAFTNTPARTSMRAPGVVQACLFTEMVIERVAAELNLPLRTVQEKNFIKDGELTICGQVVTDCTLSNVWAKAITRSRYDSRLARIQAHNASNLWRKRGIACAPVKYGMGWAGYQAGVKIGVRQSDGNVVVNHNGTEVGQGINTKVAQAIAMALGIDMSLISIEKTATDIVVNGGPTGGSGTSEVVVKAALNACDNLNKRLDPFRLLDKKAMSTSEWVKLVQNVPGDISLNTEGWFSPQDNPNGQPFQYFVYAACVTEVELNVLSGEVHVLNSEMVYDCGRSLNPAIDIGQIEGALVMGLGYFFQEKVGYEVGTGVLKTVGTWEYKPPLAQDIPSLLNVTLIADAYNKEGILGSKAVGEPPYIVSNSAFFAMKMAVASARADAGQKEYFNLPVPATVDDRQVACLVSPQRFVLPF